MNQKALPELLSKCREWQARQKCVSRQWLLLQRNMPFSIALNTVEVSNSDGDGVLSEALVCLGWAGLGILCQHAPDMANDDPYFHSACQNPSKHSWHSKEG